MEVNVGLFDNQLEANLQSTIAVVEDVLAQLGHPPSAARVDAPGTRRAWRVHQGSAVVQVALVEAADFLHLRVVAPVMTLDAAVDRAALFAHLLTLNGRDIAGAAFALSGDVVELVSERSTIDLDRSEVLDLVQRVLRYADGHDDGLVARFGGRLGG